MHLRHLIRGRLAFYFPAAAIGLAKKKEGLNERRWQSASSKLDAILLGWTSSFCRNENTSMGVKNSKPEVPKGWVAVWDEKYNGKFIH